MVILKQNTGRTVIGAGIDFNDNHPACASAPLVPNGHIHTLEPLKSNAIIPSDNRGMPAQSRQRKNSPTEGTTSVRCRTQFIKETA